MAGVTVKLDEELVEDIGVLFMTGWRVTLDRDADGAPTLDCTKDGVYISFDYEELRGRAAGGSFYGRDELRKYAQMPITTLVLLQKNREEDGW